jgi:hypothetical protein
MFLLYLNLLIHVLQQHTHTLNGFKQRILSVFEFLLVCVSLIIRFCFIFIFLWTLGQCL